MRHGAVAHPEKCPSSPQPSPDWDEVAHVLLAHRYRCATELELQNGLESVLITLSRAAAPNGFALEREARLGPKDRVDFLLGTSPNHVAVEAKIDGATNSVIRQLERYAQHEAVREVWLVTTRAQHRNGFPRQMQTKPVRVLYLAGSAFG